MIHFFENQSKTVFAVQTQNEISAQDISKLNWLFAYSNKIEKLKQKLEWLKSLDDEAQHN